MIKSIPAEDLNACVAQALSGIAQHYPQASLPSADWVLKARAKELGIEPAGQRSANRSCHLMPCEDGWLAINLARDSDWTLLNALLETDALLSDVTAFMTGTVAPPRGGSARSRSGNGHASGFCRRSQNQS